VIAGLKALRDSGPPPLDGRWTAAPRRVDILRPWA
jgi:hypothetical protein